MKATKKSKLLLLLVCFMAFNCNLVADEIITFTWKGGINKNFRIEASSNKQFTVNWGDGSVIESKTGTGNNQTLTHNYDNDSDYTVVIIGVTIDCLFTKLYIADCQLSSLDLSKNSALTFLDCAYNQLNNLDMTKNPSLYYLGCYNNQLNDL